MKELPIACTLTPSATAERVEWLQRLGAASLLAGQRRDGGLHLCFDPAAETGVRAWVRAEEECCAFLSFDFNRDGRELRLAVAGPEGSEPVLDGLLAALRGETSWQRGEGIGPRRSLQSRNHLPPTPRRGN